MKRAPAIAAAAALVAAVTTAQVEARPARRVLVVAFAGRLPPDLATTPARLTLEMADVIDDSGARVTRAPLGDLLALAGCGEPSDECLQQALAILEVDRLVMGEVEPAASDQVRVRLRLIAAGQPPRRRSFLIAGEGRAGLESSFRTRAAAFWRDPDLIDVDFDASAAAASVPEPRAADDRVSAPEDRFSARRVEPVAWGIAGSGAGFTLIGGVLLLAAADKQDQVNDAPTGSAAELEALAALEESGRDYARWGTALLVVGGVATVAGAALILTQGSDAERSGPAAGSITLAPSLLGDGLGAVLTVRGAAP